ncbi:putative bifunctional diguanylate cyclase/phosphodiesterase [Cryptosporangium phraense]|uniref:EAL domain-containing protein n=1 Tax=Cryptosporangium phraense TaxID=2593070 RepID=A0A545AK71_9ACTN|nr:EAL domain-containing protein [Cryptosporangium phraense]TQS41727.1 EAL domain-containing protein [Cryptosporangium phraense]
MQGAEVHTSPTTDGLVVRTRAGRATPIEGPSAASALATAADASASRTRRTWVAGSILAMTAPWVLWAVPPAGHAAYYLTVVAAAVVAFHLGVLRHRPVPSWPWHLIGAGLTLRFSGLLAATLWPGAALVPGFPLTVPLALRAVSFAVLVAGLVAVVKRSGPYRTHRVVDALAVSYGLGTFAWLLFVAPYLRGLHSTDRTMAFVLVMGDYALLSAAVLTVAVAVRHVAHLVVGLAGLLLVVSDFLWWLDGIRPIGNVPTTGPGVLALSGYCLMAVAAAHHTAAARRLERDQDVPTGRLRMALFGATTFAYPAFVLISNVDGRPIAPLIDIAYPAAITTAFCLYLAVRSAGLARDAYRREQEQAAQAAALGAALAEQQALQSQLTFRALHDPLTGLANRSRLTEALERTLTGASATHPYAMLLLDLDGFKDVNDTHGHPVGDELLVQAAARFGAVLPPGALLARLGGDEFAVLLEDVDEHECLALGERLTAALREPFRLAGHDLYLTTSVGLYVGAGPDAPSDVLRNADLALYAAKNAGKNQVVRYRPELQTAHLEQVEVLAGLRRAVAEGEFVLEYQPVVDLVTSRITSVEALLRWDAPGRGRISPADFVPVAEESGLIIPIGAWVLGQACADAKVWHERFGITVAVNVATAQLRHADFLTTVLGALRHAGLPPQALVLEITESTMIAATASEMQLVVSRLEDLRSRGIRVAIDDFGTGYSSLSYLRKLPVDILKIDRAFSMDDPDGAEGQDAALTRAIVQLSRSLGLSTVAEGVESSERAQVLRDLQCDRAQGFLYSQPIAAPALDELLAEQTARTPR